MDGVFDVGMYEICWGICIAGQLQGVGNSCVMLAGEVELVALVCGHIFREVAH